MKKLTAITPLLLVVPLLASAQTQGHPYRGQGYAFFGLGTGLEYSHPLVEQLGFGGEGFLYKGLGFGGEAVWSHYSFPFGNALTAWIGSVDGSYHFRRHAPHGGVDPFLFGGFSVYGPTSKEEGGRGEPGGNFGGGVNLWLADHAALRLEVREHLNTSGYLPGNTAVVFRAGVTFR
jgi:hypothetical protein